MAGDRDFGGVSRRALMQTLGAGAAAGLTAGLLARPAAAEDAILQRLIEQQGGAAHGFDSASRAIAMPRVSLPMLSATTLASTEHAIARYQEIARRGGWPTVPPVERLRIGDRHPSVAALRRRLAATGDIDAAVGATD